MPRKKVCNARQKSFHLKNTYKVYFFLGYAISCYECNSAQDKRCLGDANNQLSDDLKKPCPEKKDDKPYNLCRKIKQMIDFEVNGRKYLHLLLSYWQNMETTEI